MISGSYPHFTGTIAGLFALNKKSGYSTSCPENLRPCVFGFKVLAPPTFLSYLQIKNTFFVQNFVYVTKKQYFCTHF